MLKNFVGGFSILATVGVYSAGISTCGKIKKQKGSDGISITPFIAGAAVNFEYGLFKHDFSILITNLFGIICQSAYIIFYSIYTIQKRQLYKSITLTIIALLVLTLFIINIKNHDEHLAIQYLGIVACSLALLFFASPLISMAQVLREKHTRSLSLHFSLIALIASISWTIYGTLINDPFVQIPNILGSLISLFQLYLIYYYRSVLPYHEVHSTNEI